MTPVQAHVRIHGRVQGVGFRWHVRQKAAELGVQGWVRNCDDGTVEALFVGLPAAVERILAWSREGPPASRVTHVDIDQQPATTPFEGFHVLR